ncbi:MAG: TonB-dependent siderophore receptor [Luteitalea sp.]|nr:TonB-dependent siderophore receptor [Luteitalea sp.]
MTRKRLRALRRTATQKTANAGRPSQATRFLRFGAAVTTAALTSLAANPAFASDLLDPRLEVIKRALWPRTAPSGISSSGQQDTNRNQTFQFDIPGAPIGDVVAAFERVTGGTVTIPVDSIHPIFSPGLRGTFTFEQGLHMLLDGTGITFRLTSPQTAVLALPSLSESVSVRGSVATVASPKYSAPLRDIPQTIEVIPRAAMETQGVTTLSEALRNVPGITLQAGEGGGASSTAGDMFTMRGFNASNSLFVDNVRDDGLVSRDVFNLEQVEVFMGPTGSDVGRGTAAGYVNMQTKRPHLPRATSATLAYGTADQRRATLDLNQPLSSANPDSWIGKSALRLNALWQDSGVAGRDEVENETRAFAPSLGLGLGTSTRVLASAQVLRQRNLPDYGIPGAAWHETQLAPTTKHTSRPVDQSNYYGSPAFDYDRADQNTLMARVEHNVTAGWALSNQTRYNKTEREAVISTVQSVASYVPATDLVTVARQGNARENEIISNQTTVSGRFLTGGLEHNISSGLEFAREAQFAPAITGVGTRAPVNIYNPNPNDPITGYAVTPTNAFTDGQTDTAAIYAFDSLSLGTRVQVNGGLRFEHYNTEYRSVSAANVTTADESGSGGLLSGKAGVIVRLRPNGNVYASYGTTITPPGGANFTLSAAPANQNNPNVEPQKSANVEVGTKWDVAGGRLSLNGAVFHTINENVLFVIDAAAVPPVYNQDDKQRVNGVTVGATGQITPEWQVLASAGYLDTESLTQNTANNGNRLTLSPELSGSFWTTYRLPKGWTLGGGVRGTSEVFINAANTIKAPGYHIVDGLVEYAVNQHLTLRFNVYNLTDTEYIRNVNNNGGRYNPGNPRTAQLTSVIAF